MGLMPEFDPLKKTITSAQFVDRVEQIQRSHGWNDCTVLVAIHHKLKGYAKQWLDAQPVFQSWQAFSRSFKKDFPSVTSTAELISTSTGELIKRRRKPGESLTEFYFVMQSIGKRADVDERSMISYIINGLNNYHMTQSLLAMNLKTYDDLFASLENLATLTETRVSSAAMACATSKQPNALNKREDNGPKCYNCHGVGHFARKCPHVQRRPQCSKCSKFGHEGKDCRSTNKAQVTSVNGQKPVIPPMIKQIVVAGEALEAFVDTGSDCSLIRKSSVPAKSTMVKIGKRLTGFGGAVVHVTELVEVKVTLDDRRVEANLCVIPDELLEYPVLLGRDLLCGVGHEITMGEGVIQLQTSQNVEFNVGTNLKEEERQQVVNVLKTYDKSFAEGITGLGRCTTATMKIQVTTEKPIVGKRYQVPLAQRGKLSEILSGLLANGIIRPSTSPHAASVVLVNKANGESRMCVDYRAINEVTVKKQYPMPNVEEQLAQLSGNRLFTTLDMTSGYYQIPMEESSKIYTAFITHDGLYEHNVMPFGLVNAPMCFQEMVTNIIRPLKKRNNIICYVDEVIIATNTVTENIDTLKEFLEAVRKANLTLRPSKCVFLSTSVNFLGHVVDGDGIRPGEVKVKCIAEFPRPTNVTEVRQFLGVTGFFRKFIEGYGMIAKPLTNLLKKGAEFKWRDEEENAFTGLKTALTTKPVLALYDPSKEHEVHTDASAVGLSGILMQSDDGKWKPVFYYSRRCAEAESRYASHELEVLAIVEALQRFRVYLLGTFFRVVTDCNAIATTKAITPLLPRVARWWLKLQEYNFEVRHRPGLQMSHVDGMSRAPSAPPQTVEPVAEHVLHLSVSPNDGWILSLQMQDDKLKEIVRILKGKEASNKKQIKAEYELAAGRLMRKEVAGNRLVVPKLVRWRIARACHDEAGHFGVEKTLQRMSKDFWFPRMRRYIKSYIASCPECCFNKAKGGKTEGQLHLSEITPIPFRCLHLDHLGPFPKSKRGNSYLLVIVCSFSKYVILKALRNTKTTPVLTTLQETMSTFGLPVRLVTDRGTAFTSREFSNFVTSYGIEHVKVAVRTPRANGQAERVNKTVLSSLKCSTTEVKDWDRNLLHLQWCLNSQKNATTTLCPNELVFSFNPRSVSLNRLVQCLNDEPTSTEVESQDYKTKTAIENMTKSRQKWKERFDARRRKPHQYKENDLVVIDYVPPPTGGSHKLDPKYKGPYVVTKVLDHDRYVVEDLPDAPRCRKPYSGVMSSDNLKPWAVPVTDLDESDYDEEQSSGDEELSGEAELSHSV